MVHRESASARTDSSVDEERHRRTVDIRVLDHKQKCSGLDTLSVLSNLEPPSLQLHGRHGQNPASDSLEDSVSGENRHPRDSSPTSLNDSDQIGQLPVNKWAIKEVHSGRPELPPEKRSPLDRFEGTFDLPIPDATSTLRTGYSRLHADRWLKYLHDTPQGVTLQLSGRLGSSQQLAAVSEVLEQLSQHKVQEVGQDFSAGSGSVATGSLTNNEHLSLQNHEGSEGGIPVTPTPPTTVSLANNNLGLEALPRILRLCQACPGLENLDLSRNQHLFSAPLDVSDADRLTSLFFSTVPSALHLASRKASLEGHSRLQEFQSNALDAPAPEQSIASAGSNRNMSEAGSPGRMFPSALKSLKLNGNIIGASVLGLVSACIAHQGRSVLESEANQLQAYGKEPENAYGLQELHLQAAELDSVAFCALLWGHSGILDEALYSSKDGGVLLQVTGLRTRDSNSSFEALRCVSRPDSTSGSSSVASGSFHRSSLMGGKGPDSRRSHTKQKGPSSAGVLRSRSGYRTSTKYWSSVSEFLGPGGTISGAVGVARAAAALAERSISGSLDGGNRSSLTGTTRCSSYSNCSAAQHELLNTPSPHFYSESALKYLRVLNLAGCLQAGKHMAGLARIISTGCSWECLNLEAVGASRLGYQGLSAALWSGNSSLVELSVAAGDLSWPAALCLSLAVMHHQQNLKRLDISRCRITSLGLSALLKAAAASSSLESLSSVGVLLVQLTAAQAHGSKGPDEKQAELATVNSDRILSVDVQLQSLDAQAAKLSKAGPSTINTQHCKPSAHKWLLTLKEDLDTGSTYACVTSSEISRLKTTGAGFITRVVTDATSARKVLQSCVADGPDNCKFDLSSIEGWSLAANCLSLHVAGSLQCSCVQTPSSTASLGSRRFKTVLTTQQLADTAAVTKFCGDMLEEGVLKMTLKLSCGDPAAVPGAPERKSEMKCSDELFKSLCQNMKGVRSLDVTKQSVARASHPPDQVWKSAFTDALEQSGVQLSASQQKLWNRLQY